ncbi:MAG: SGNH/GDSL hydrolase family protein [Acidobacteriota bacterium]
MLIGEAALRVLGVSHPNFYGPDPVRGWGLIPGSRGWWRSEGEAFVEINSDGFRGPSRVRPKPPGVLRVAILGDSCAEAVQVPYEATFAARLERSLATCPGVGARRVEVLDLGVSGYGTTQELLTLRDQGLSFAPDVVLLAFYSGNDVRNNSRTLDADPARPYPVVGADGALSFDDSFRATGGFRLRSTLPAQWLYRLFNHVRLLQLAKNGETAIKTAIGTARARRNETGGALQELGLDNAVYSPPTESVWSAAWSSTEALFTALRSDSTAAGARFAIVSLTTPMQVNPDRAARDAFARKLGVADLFYPDDRIVAWGAAHEVPVLALARPLQELAEHERLYLHGFVNSKLGEGHWNEQGHAAAAERLEPFVCQLLSPR